jgi:hypothetical protein
MTSLSWMMLTMTVLQKPDAPIRQNSRKGEREEMSDAKQGGRKEKKDKPKRKREFLDSVSLAQRTLPTHSLTSFLARFA